MTVTEVAQSYLGNCLEDSSLYEQVKSAQASNRCFEVELSEADCAKSRIHLKLRPDFEVGIIKERGWNLREGDVFKTEGDRLLLIHLEPQQLVTLSIPDISPESMRPEFLLSLIHLGHSLGNHHCPILIAEDKIYIQLAGNREVIESTIQAMNVPGLAITYETRSATQHLAFPKHSHPASSHHVHHHH
jgi:urease accessory protein